jgi:hypothetical protein
VLKPELVPAEMAEGKFLLLRDVAFKGGKRDALVVKFPKGGYVAKFMKTRMKTFVTVRPISGKSIDVKQISEDVFNKRVLPAIWDKPLYYGSLKRESKIMRAGAWLPQDDWSVDGKGGRVAKDGHAKRGYGPIGLGFYKRVDFYTDGKFISYKLLGGPPVSRKKAEDKKEPDK